MSGKPELIDVETHIFRAFNIGEIKQANDASLVRARAFEQTNCQSFKEILDDQEMERKATNKYKYYEVGVSSPRKASNPDKDASPQEEV